MGHCDIVSAVPTALGMVPSGAAAPKGSRQGHLVLEQHFVESRAGATLTLGVCRPDCWRTRRPDPAIAVQRAEQRSSPVQLRQLSRRALPPLQPVFQEHGRTGRVQDCKAQRSEARPYLDKQPPGLRHERAEVGSRARKLTTDPQLDPA